MQIDRGGQPRLGANGTDIPETKCYCGRYVQRSDRLPVLQAGSDQ